jgi:hypothetical protein
VKDPGAYCYWGTPILASPGIGERYIWRCLVDSMLHQFASNTMLAVYRNRVLPREQIEKTKITSGVAERSISIQCSVSTVERSVFSKCEACGRSGFVLGAFGAARARLIEGHIGRLRGL